MPLSSDALIERLKLKQQLSRWRIGAVAFAILALIVTFEQNSSSGKASPIEREFIARLTIEDMIMDDKDRTKLIEDIIDNPKIKAVVVQLDTPGGEAVAGEELYLQMLELSKVKPTVAVMRNMATSAGYMIAIGTDYIVAREGTITGSIGVLLQTAEMTELAKKIGITPIEVKSAPLKGSPSPFEKASPEALQSLQDVIDDFYKHFVAMVAERRKLPMEEATRLADGRVYSGTQAVKNKLIDAIGGENEAIAWLQANKGLKKDLPVKDVEVEKDEVPSWIREFTDSAARKVFPQALTPLDGLAAIWHPSLQTK